MRLTSKILFVTAVCVLSASPAFALPPQAHDNAGAQHAPAGTPPVNQGTEHKPSTPGPRSSAKAKGKAYGKYCQDQSKKHVKGQKGTPFSQCVTAMAKLASGKAATPHRACKALSRKRAEGQKRSPFSKCVSGGAKLLRDRD
jgi:hypothetical protein